MLLLATIFLQYCISAKLFIIIIIFLSWLKCTAKHFYNKIIVEFMNIFDYMQSNFLLIIICGGSPIYPFIGQLKVGIKYIANILRPSLVHVIKYKPYITFICIIIY